MKDVAVFQVLSSRIMLIPFARNVLRVRSPDQPFLLREVEIDSNVKLESNSKLWYLGEILGESGAV